MKTGEDNIYYTLKDYLGSIMVIANASGTKLEEYSYDAWGRRRNKDNWTYSSVSAPTYITRGYTGHEHIEEVGLINMNGRVYDPLVGLFLSPDPIVQSPYDVLNYNRYSYVGNNPLKYTDPSGYIKQSPFTEWQKSDHSGGVPSPSLVFGWMTESRYEFNYGDWSGNNYSYDGEYYYDTYTGEIVSFGNVYNNFLVSESRPATNKEIGTIYGDILGDDYGLAYNGDFEGEHVLGFINKKTYDGGGWSTVIILDNLLNTPTVYGSAAANGGINIKNPGIVYKDKYEQSISLGGNFIINEVTMTLGKTYTIGNGNIVMTSTNGKPPKQSYQKSFGNLKLTYSDNSFGIVASNNNGGYSISISSDGITSGAYSNDGNNWSSNISVTADYNWKNIGLYTLGVTAAVLAPQVVVAYPKLIPSFGF